MKEWLSNDPDSAKAFLMLASLILAGIGVWFGRKRLRVAIPLALVFLIWVAIAIPNLVTATSYTQRTNCLNHLRMLESAKDQWARVEHKLSTDVPTDQDLFGTNKFLPLKPVCPRGGTYRIGAVNEKPTCSIGWHKLE
jgi:hypothetical protein